MRPRTTSSGAARLLAVASIIAMGIVICYPAIGHADSGGVSPSILRAVDASPALGRATISLAEVKPNSDRATIIKELSAGIGFDSFVQGEGPMHITVFIDPNCIYCHRFWTELTGIKGWTERYTVRWIPVGFLKPSSEAKAANILRRGPAGLIADESHFDVAQEEGAIKPLHNAALLAKVAANTKHWAADLRALGVSVGTPTIVTATGHVFAGLVPLARINRADLHAGG